MSLAGIAMFVYTVLLKPWPLRWLTNQALLFLIPASIKLPEGELFLNQKDPVISGALALGVYEPYQLQVFRSLIQDGAEVVDVGANVGLYSLIAAGLGAHVTSFEPEPDNFALLSKNCPTATKYQYALADAEGTLELHLSKDNMGKHSFYLSGESITVPTKTLDSLITKADLIKIDVEGAEMMVLDGMKSILASKPILMVEYEPESLSKAGYQPTDLLKKLSSYGYSLWNIDEARKELVFVTPSFIPKQGYTNILCR